MPATRIVANLYGSDPNALARFYKAAFGLEMTSDLGGIAVLSRQGEPNRQLVELHTASEGCSGTEPPVISIGVDDLDATEAAVRAAGAKFAYGLTNFVGGPLSAHEHTA